MELHELGTALFIAYSLYCGILYISITAIHIREAELCSLLDTLKHATCRNLNWIFATRHTVLNSLLSILYTALEGTF